MTYINTVFQEYTQSSPDLSCLCTMWLQTLKQEACESKVLKTRLLDSITLGYSWNIGSSPATRLLFFEIERVTDTADTQRGRLLNEFAEWLTHKKT